jgi:hypothetical protein
MNERSEEPAGRPLVGFSRMAINRRRLLQVAAATGVLPLAEESRAEIWEEGDAQCRPRIAEVEPAYPLNDALLADFVKLSEILTGIKPLDHRLGSQYLDRYARHPNLTALLPPLVEAYRDIQSSGDHSTSATIEKAIMQTELRPAAEQLIYLWYVSAFYLPVSGDATLRKWIYGTPEQYDRSLLWKVVHAHPPMTKGGSPGYWAQLPV